MPHPAKSINIKEMSNGIKYSTKEIPSTLEDEFP
jgi:hypothetical protein